MTIPRISFYYIWTGLDRSGKEQLAASYDVTKNYLSEIAHGRCPSTLLALGLSHVLSVPPKTLFPSLQLPKIGRLAIDPGLTKFKKKQLKLSV